MKEFSQIFNEIVGQISSQIKVESQTSNNYFTFKTKWSRKGKTLTGYDINGNLLTKKIINVVNNEYITLEDGLIISNTLVLNEPFDITGTKIATNLEWTKASTFAIDKTPLVWLLDSFDELIYGLESSMERTVDMKVFFLDETDIKNYYTADHKREVIQPMMNLKDEFLAEIKKK